MAAIYPSMQRCRTFIQLAVYSGLLFAMHNGAVCDGFMSTVTCVSSE